MLLKVFHLVKLKKNLYTNTHTYTYIYIYTDSFSDTFTFIGFFNELCGSPHNSYNDHSAISMILANETWISLLVYKKQMKFLFSSSQSHFQYVKLCWFKPSKKTAREQLREVLETQKFHNQNSCQNVRSGTGSGNRCFWLEFACNFNPLQNIIRLFFRFFSAAENSVCIYSRLAFPPMTPSLPFSQHSLALHSESKKEGWEKSCNQPSSSPTREGWLFCLLFYQLSLLTEAHAYLSRSSP